MGSTQWPGDARRPWWSRVVHAFDGGGAPAALPATLFRAATEMTADNLTSFVYTTPPETKQGDLLLFTLGQNFGAFAVTPPAGASYVGATAPGAAGYLLYQAYAAADGAQSWEFTSAAPQFSDGVCVCLRGRCSLFDWSAGSGFSTVWSLPAVNAPGDVALVLSFLSGNGIGTDARQTLRLVDAGRGLALFTDTRDWTEGGSAGARSSGCAGSFSGFNLCVQRPSWGVYDFSLLPVQASLASVPNTAPAGAGPLVSSPVGASPAVVTVAGKNWGAFAGKPQRMVGAFADTFTLGDPAVPWSVYMVVNGWAGTNSPYFWGLSADASLARTGVNAFPYFAQLWDAVDSFSYDIGATSNPWTPAAPLYAAGSQIVCLQVAGTSAWQWVYATGQPIVKSAAVVLDPIAANTISNLVFGIGDSGALDPAVVGVWPELNWLQANLGEWHGTRQLDPDWLVGETLAALAAKWGL